MASAPCPACLSPLTQIGPASRTTGRRVGRCPQCHAHFWANPTEQTVAPVPLSDYSADDYGRWVEKKREGVGADAWRLVLDRLRHSLDGVAAPRLYDVGAGDGGFLALARDEFGFEVTGNEILEGAVALAKERHGVDLELGNLDALDRRSEFDAVTLWCVLAHVVDGEELLTNVRDLLRPGGLLFLQTPHWTYADAAAHYAQRVNRGRASRLTDRRVAYHHRILHTRRSIAAQLTRLGFRDVEVTPTTRYSLSSRAYLTSLKVPPWSVRPAAWVMDRAIASGVAPRIVLDVYARRA